MTLRQLTRVFERSEASCGRALPIQRTRLGIWVPTPVRVAKEAIEKLTTIGLLGEGTPENHVIDAGTGDGRIPAVLAALDPTRVVYGIEVDPGLYARAVMNLQTLAASGVIPTSPEVFATARPVADRRSRANAEGREVTLTEIYAELAHALHASPARPRGLQLDKNIDPIARSGEFVDSNPPLVTRGVKWMLTSNACTLVSSFH